MIATFPKYLPPPLHPPPLPPPRKDHLVRPRSPAMVMSMMTNIIIIIIMKPVQKIQQIYGKTLSLPSPRKKLERPFIPCSLALPKNRSTTRCSETILLPFFRTEIAPPLLNFTSTIIAWKAMEKNKWKHCIRRRSRRQSRTAAAAAAAIPTLIQKRI